MLSLTRNSQDSVVIRGPGGSGRTLSVTPPSALSNGTVNTLDLLILLGNWT